VVARLTARRMEEAGVASTRAVPSPLKAARSTSDELTVLYYNGPDDRSVKLALGYVNGTLHCIAHGGGRRCQQEGCLKSARGDTGAF
jgi:hypothetical protein